MSGVTGLDQVRAMLDGGTGIPMAATLGFSLVEVGEGYAIFEGRPDERAYNPVNTVHGGYAATLLDSACGIATQSRLGPGQTYTTLELKIAYHRPMSAETGLVRAIGSIISFGRRVAFVEAKLTDPSGRLLASATSTLLIITQ